MNEELRILFAECHSLPRRIDPEVDPDELANRLAAQYRVGSTGERILIRAVFSFAPWLAELVSAEDRVEDFALSSLGGLDEGNTRGLLMAIALGTGNRALAEEIGYRHGR